MTPAAAPSKVNFDIGRITLHGYSPGQRTRFVNSLRARLTDLAATDGHGWPTGQRQIGHVDAGLLPPNASPEQAARRIAARILAAAAGGRERHE
jgi:hypothetical protein